MHTSGLLNANIIVKGTVYQYNKTVLYSCEAIQILQPVLLCNLTNVINE